MTENNTEKDNFGEFENLAAVLRATDLSGKSKVRESLKARLLSKDAKEENAFFFARNWLIPAAATALAVLAITMINPRKGQVVIAEYPAYYQPPDSGNDIYAACGRQGLKDYLSAPRF